MLQPVFTKQKNLEQLQHLLKHYQQVYPQARQQGKVVLLQYLKKLNHQIQHLQFRSQGRTRF
ncbi:hypothetical protein [Chlorogloea sp. CCALA 695]|uniref:hypothetical protein n=1 Tax=Chlorogloea sp. CCALA 695 TaxID=2107693 RepID=UPI000D068F7B|nr:hypothetical protein [Chlorogloea sp. CCALA 695]PSB31379.1 hypothetical protein C7B70_13700 [Chlorogloea sp. CCALA 695]